MYCKAVLARAAHFAKSASNSSYTSSASSSVSALLEVVSEQERHETDPLRKARIRDHRQVLEQMHLQVRSDLVAISPRSRRGLAAVSSLTLSWIER